MDPRLTSVRCMPRRKALALSVSAVLVLSAPGLASASTWLVNSCDEGSSGNTVNKTGTLRFAAEHALSGDLINMTSLNCAGSKISLTTGSIGLAQDSLTIAGPGSSALQIDISADNPGLQGDYRIFSHSGGGKLTVQDLGLSGGHVYHTGVADPSKGGCLYSKGSVDLVNMTVSSCAAQSSNNFARGGGVYVTGNLKLSHSILTGSSTAGSTSAYGGGAYSKGSLTLEFSSISGNTAASNASARGGGAFASYVYAYYSTISNNHAGGTAASARGGGLVAGGDVTIGYSTISGNSSDGDFGGVLATNEVSYADNKVSIFSSTISGNTAAGIVGGAYTDASVVFIEHSTVAFNTAGVGKSNTYFAPGIAIGANNPSTQVEFESSILSNNTYAAIESDLSIAVNPITVTGANNLVRAAHDVAFSESKVTACPLLGPLRDNGGLTKTHALLSRSPAIDAGNLVDATNVDQRGPASQNGTQDYYRVSGPIGDLNPLPDIGAYEVQQDEIVFNASFEGCP